MDNEERVKKLLANIEAEKRQPNPDQRQIKKWFNTIVQLKEDWRATWTGQENKFRPKSLSAID
jgi:hypothetical protein